MVEPQISKEKDSARINYIDIFRSFGIIAMIMGHIGFGQAFDYFIHAFHMPMFFWISGFLFHQKPKSELSFCRFVLKKTKTLLFPYFIFGIAHYLLYMTIYDNDIGISPLVHLFSVNTEGLVICGALWFLTALFFTDIIFFLIDRYVPNELLKVSIIIAITLVGFSAKTLFQFTLPFALGTSFVGVGMYYIGYWCKQHMEHVVIHSFMNLPWTANVILGAITIIAIFSNGYINMRTENYANISLFWINVILSITVGINFAKLINTHIKDTFIEKWLISVGQDSIVYVCLNQLVISVVRRGINLSNLPMYVALVLTLAITLLILFAISKMIMDTKLRIFVGKF